MNILINWHLNFQLLLIVEKIVKGKALYTGQVSWSSRRGIPGNSWWVCAAKFFESWPYFRPKKLIFHTRFQTRPLKSIPVFRPGLKPEIMLSLLRLGRRQKKFSKSISNSHFPFSFLLIWNWNDKNVHTLPKFSPKPYPISDQNGQKVHPFSNQTGAKTLPDGAAHTYLACIREYKSAGPARKILHFPDARKGWKIK